MVVISLFDGETLNGWGATGSAEGWVIDDGEYPLHRSGRKIPLHRTALR